MSHGVTSLYSAYALCIQCCKMLIVDECAWPYKYKDGCLHTVCQLLITKILKTQRQGR